MKKNLLVLIGLIGCLNLFAQKETTVLDIDGHPVSRSEFLQIYLKNNPAPKYDKASLDEYMELFKKFKLKVAEAELLGYDTIPKLKKELDGYRKTLSLPYLVDNAKNAELVEQAYNRSKIEIRASHILIRLDENASPADTLRAYNRLMALKKRIENGEDFATVAKGKGGSEDPSAEKNGGDLGYFTAFQMVYPFEEAAFNTPVGKMSNPIRTRFGYHLIKVVGQRPARGSIKVAHIMVAVGKDDPAADIENARKKIEEIYAKVKAGENFEELASTYSDDPGSNGKGGVLPAFGSGSTTRMVPEFEEAAFALKNNGDVSAPVLTDYGYHIIKKIEWTDIQSFDQMKKELQAKVNRDERSKKTQDSFVAKLKKEYKYKNSSKKGLVWFEQNIDSTYYTGNWNASNLKTDKVLFTLDGKAYTQQQFGIYLTSNARISKKASNKELIAAQYKNWEKSTIIAYEETKLEAKYPEFKALMREYHDGILLYEIMTDKVWNKASKDTIGLQQYYAQNKAKYQWKERADAMVYECYTKEIAAQVYKMVQNDTITSKHVIDKINKESELNLRVRTNKFEISETPFLANQNLKKGVNAPYEVDGKFYVVKIDQIIPAGPKELAEAKGAITSDFQNQLEKDWLAELSQKHPIKVYNEVLYSIGQ
jgi:peptidyl-prolyl cis-trans isomerase SurA